MLKIDPEAEKVVKSYIKALASSGPHNWKGFYQDKSSLFKWPLFYPIRGYEHQGERETGTRERFARENESTKYTHVNQENQKLYNFDIMHDLEKIWVRDIEKNINFKYGAIINGLQSYFDKNFSKIENDDSCLITSEAKDVIMKKVQEIMEFRKLDVSCLKTDVAMLHPVNYTFSLWAVRNLKSSLNTRDYKTQIFKCIHELDVQCDVVSKMVGVDRQLDAVRVIVFPMTSFSDKSLIQAMKTLKTEKDDTGKFIISLMKEHPVHKGVWSFRINKFGTSKKYGFNPSKLTNEHACLLLTREAFKRLRSPIQILDYIKPVIPTSSAMRQRISPEIYKGLLGIFVSMAQQTRFFSFSDYVKMNREFSEGNHALKHYNFIDREDYVPDRLKNIKNAGLPFTEDQKKAVGLAMRGFQGSNFMFVTGCKGSGKTTCLLSQITHDLGKSLISASCYIQMRKNHNDVPNLLEQMNGHERFVVLDISKREYPVLQLAGSSGLQELVAKNDFDEELGISLPGSFVAWESIGNVSYFLDNYDDSLDNEFLTKVILPMVEHDQTRAIWIAGREHSKNPDPSKFRSAVLGSRLRGSVQINQMHAELCKTDLVSKNFNFVNLDTHVLMGTDVEMLGYNNDKSMAEIINKLVVLVLDKSRSFGETAKNQDVLVTTICPPELVSDSGFIRQKDMIRDSCNIELVQFWDLETEKGFEDKKCNEMQNLEDYDARVKSDYPIVVVGVYGDDLKQLRGDVKGNVKIPWVAKALETVVGKAMCHVIVVASEEVCREARCGIFPPEYADKSFGVKLARALMNGL